MVEKEEMRKWKMVGDKVRDRGIDRISLNKTFLEIYSLPSEERHL